jgi:nucleoside-diphosphate-sugar epimerase
MNISIIGATSFLASGIIYKMLNNSSLNLTLFGRPNDQLRNVTTYEYNFPDRPINYPLLLSADVIIFCAAAGVQSNKSVSETEMFELNCFEVIRLFQFLDKNKFGGKLITFGSYFELGNNEEQKFYTEEDFLKANFKKAGHYAVSKSLLSKFLADQFHTRDQLPFTFYHLILPTIYGRSESENRLIPYIIHSVKNEQPISLSEGRQVRQYANVEDVSDFVIRLTKIASTSGIYNISVKETLSVRALSEKVISLAERRFGKKALVSFGTANRQDISMPFLALDSSKARVLGWFPMRSIDDGINDYF